MKALSWIQSRLYVGGLASMASVARMGAIAGVAGFAGLAGVLGAADMASAEIRLDPVEYKAGDTTLRGWIAYDPALQGKRPGVIVVHEWWGLNDYTKMRAKMLAEAGYVAFAADMYGDGKATEHPKEAGEWAGSFAKDKSMASERFQAALAKLQTDAHVDPAHISAIGYCFGGSIVLDMAMGGADLDGVVSFHAGIPTDPATGKVSASILVCHGAADGFATPEQIQTFQQHLADAGADWAFISYGGAKHAFTNPGADKHGIDGIAYNEKADKRSWRAMVEFLGEVTK